MAARPRQDKEGLAGLRDLRVKYFTVLEEQVVRPAVLELNERTDLLRTELGQLESAGPEDVGLMRKGLEAEIEKLDRARESVEVGYQRLRRLRLRDLPTSGRPSVAEI